MRWKQLIAEKVRRCAGAVARGWYLPVTAVVLTLAVTVALVPRALSDAADNAAAVPAATGPAPGTAPNDEGVYNFGSGYSAIDGTFTRASASWTEPTATCDGGNQATGFWVGLSGSGTIAQTGTAANCDGSTPVYYSWWEMYPSSDVTLSNATKPGDQMMASVTYDGGNVFQFALTDSTEGWKAIEQETQVATGGSPVSANFIVEANTDTGVGSGNTTDFGSVAFTDCQVNGAALSSFTLWTGNLVDANGVQEDTISPLSDAGTAFTATWDSTG